MFKTIQDEQRLGTHSGVLDFKEFSYVYLYIEWDDKKNKDKKWKKIEAEQ